MSKIKIIAAAGVLALTMSASAANAVVSTFANFSAVSSATNFRWVGGNGTVAAGTRDDAVFYTTSTATATAPGSTNSNFSFTLGGLPLNIPAKFLLSGTVTDTAATINGVNLVQSKLVGTFSFLSTNAVSYGIGYAAGSNLLSGTFTQTTLSGPRNGGTAGINGSTQGGSTIAFTSDFVTFDPASNFELSWSLSSIAPLLNALPTNGPPARATRNFRAVIGGQFSSDPAPIINSIPEPEVWALLVVGFGLVGVQVRRRNRQSAIAA